MVQGSLETFIGRNGRHGMGYDAGQVKFVFNAAANHHANSVDQYLKDIGYPEGGIDALKEINKRNEQSQADLMKKYKDFNGWKDPAALAKMDADAKNDRFGTDGSANGYIKRAQWAAQHGFKTVQEVEWLFNARQAFAPSTSMEDYIKQLAGGKDDGHLAFENRNKQLLDEENKQQAKWQKYKDFNDWGNANAVKALNEEAKKDHFSPADNSDGGYLKRAQWAARHGFQNAEEVDAIQAVAQQMKEPSWEKVIKSLTRSDKNKEGDENKGHEAFEELRRQIAARNAIVGGGGGGGNDPTPRPAHQAVSFDDFAKANPDLFKLHSVEEIKKALGQEHAKDAAGNDTGKTYLEKYGDPTKAVQAYMKDNHYYEGNVDGDFGGRSRKLCETHRGL